MSETCAYAPMHRPDCRGICKHCDGLVDEPWFMRRRPEPAELVAEIAARHGATLPRHVAQIIADAMQSYATASCEYRQTMSRQAWQVEPYRAATRADMRYQLLKAVTEQGLIPTALPSEALRYLKWVWSEDDPFGDVPPDAVQAGADFAMVEIIMAVPVRAPVVDRAAAVRAGLL